jgi:hypothetical protein
MVTAEVKRALDVGAQKAEDFHTAQLTAASEIESVGTAARQASDGVRQLLSSLHTISSGVDERVLGQQRAGQDMNDALGMILPTAVGTDKLQEPIALLQIASAGNEVLVNGLLRLKEQMPGYELRLNGVLQFLGELAGTAAEMGLEFNHQAVASATAADRTRTYSAML